MQPRGRLEPCEGLPGFGNERRCVGGPVLREQPFGVLEERNAQVEWSSEVAEALFGREESRLHRVHLTPYRCQPGGEPSGMTPEERRDLPGPGALDESQQL